MLFDSDSSGDNYAKTAANNKVTKDLIEYLTSISEGGATPFKAPVTFSKADGTDVYNKNLMFQLGTNIKDLANGPVVVALRNGKGYTMSGPQIVSELKGCVAKMGGQEAPKAEAPKAEEAK